MRSRVVLTPTTFSMKAIRCGRIGDFCIDQVRGAWLIAVLVPRKQRRSCCAGRCTAVTWVGVEVPDRYVFGYGMDFHEQGRNLPGIYALKES